MYLHTMVQQGYYDDQQLLVYGASDHVDDRYLNTYTNDANLEGWPRDMDGIRCQQSVSTDPDWNHDSSLPPLYPTGDNGIWRGDAELTRLPLSSSGVKHTPSGTGTCVKVDEETEDLVEAINREMKMFLQQGAGPLDPGLQAV